MPASRHTRTLSIAVAATLSTAVAVAAPHASATSGWLQGGFNGAHTSYNSTEHTLSVASVKHLEKKYNAPNVAGAAIVGKKVFEATAGGIYTYKASNHHKSKKYTNIVPVAGIPSTPVVGGGLIFASYGNTLYATKIKGGKTAWKSHLKKDTGAVSHWWSDITLSGNQLFAVLHTSGVSASDATSKLIAMTAATGKTLWSKPDYFGPIAAGYGSVFAQHNGTNVGPGSYNHTVTAFAGTNGAPLWAAPHEFALIQSVHSIVITPGVIVVGCGNSTSGDDIYGLSPATGAQIWSHKDTSGNVAPAGVAPVTNGTILTYISAQDRINALTLATGHYLWSRDAAQDGGAVGANGVVYAVTSYNTNKPGKFIAYQMSNGKKLWQGPQLLVDVVAVGAGRLLGLDTAAGGTATLVAFGKK